MSGATELSRQAWVRQRVLKIRYQKPEDDKVVDREVEVYGWNGVYLDTFCRLRREPRTFRIDRIVDASLLDTPSHWDPGVAAFLLSHGWTGAVARPSVSEVPDKASESVRHSATDTNSKGVWDWLRRILGIAQP